MRQPVPITVGRIPAASPLTAVIHTASAWAAPLFARGCAGLAWGREFDSFDDVVPLGFRRTLLNEFGWYALTPAASPMPDLSEVEYVQEDEDALVWLQSLSIDESRADAMILREECLILISQSDALGGRRAAVIFPAETGGHDSFEEIERIKESFNFRFEDLE